MSSREDMLREAFDRTRREQRAFAILAVLDGAAEILALPERWTQSAEARDAAGNPVFLTSPDAVCFCVLGALARASGCGERGHSFAHRFAFMKAAEALENYIGVPVVEWSDDPSRTHVEVVAVLRETAAAGLSLQ